VRGVDYNIRRITETSKSGRTTPEFVQIVSFWVAKCSCLQNGVILIKTLTFYFFLYTGHYMARTIFCTVNDWRNKWNISEEIRLSLKRHFNFHNQFRKYLNRPIVAGFVSTLPLYSNRRLAKKLSLNQAEYLVFSRNYLPIKMYALLFYTNIFLERSSMNINWKEIMKNVL